MTLSRVDKSLGVLQNRTPCCASPSNGKTVGRSMGRSAGRSAGGSVGRPLVGGSFGVLVDRMTRNATCFANVGRLGRPVGQEVGRPVGWSVGRSIPATRSTRCLAHAGPGESAGRPVGRPGVRPVELSLRPCPLFPKEFFKIHRCKESY